MKRLDPPYNERQLRSAAEQFVSGRGRMTIDLCAAICARFLTLTARRAVVLTLIQGGRKSRRRASRRTRRMDAPPL